MPSALERMTSMQNLQKGSSDIYTRAMQTQNLVAEMKNTAKERGIQERASTEFQQMGGDLGAYVKSGKTYGELPINIQMGMQKSLAEQSTLAGQKTAATEHAMSIGGDEVGPREAGQEAMGDLAGAYPKEYATSVMKQKFADEQGDTATSWTRPIEAYNKDSGQLQFLQVHKASGEKRWLPGAIPPGKGKVSRAIQGETAAELEAQKAMESGESIDDANRKIKLRARELYGSTVDLQYHEVPNADGTSSYMSYDPFSGEEVEVFRGERKLVPDAVRNKAAQTMVDRGEARMALGVVKKTYKPEYLTFQNRAEEWFKKPLHKLDPTADAEEIAEIEKGLTPDKRQKSREYWQWRGMVQRSFDLYRKKITGAQAALQELERLQENYLSGKMSDPQFRGNLDSIMALAEQETNFNKIIVEQNRYPTDDELDNFAQTMYQNMADTTYADARKKAKGMADKGGGVAPSKLDALLE